MLAISSLGRTQHIDAHIQGACCTLSDYKLSLVQLVLKSSLAGAYKRMLQHIQLRSIHESKGNHADSTPSFDSHH